MRLNRYLAVCGVSSRRRAERLISEGRVEVNGEPVGDPATPVEPGRDRVRVDGRPVSLPERHTYLLLHKPPGTVSTAEDPEGRPKVTDLVPPEPRVFPVGRLDLDTSGALLLTDDGDLAHRLLHPRYEIEKEYDILVEGAVTDETVRALRRGIQLEDEPRPTAPAVVEIRKRRAHRTRLTMILHEGRKRQVRRMLERVGHLVVSLRRVRIGPVALGDLAEGTYRTLQSEEVAALRRTVQLPEIGDSKG
jgi:pseudouridine synthase